MLAALAIVFTAGLCAAAPPAGDVLAPATTKGFYSVPDLKAADAALKQTQIGMLANDPVMAPFTKDLQRQLEGRLAGADVRLGISFDDLAEVASGQTTLAIVQPGGDKAKHAMAIMVDVTGQHMGADRLLFKSERNLVAQGAVKTKFRLADVTVNKFALKQKPGDKTPSDVFQARAGDLLIACDDLATLTDIFSRLDGKNPAGSISQEQAFKVSTGHAIKAVANQPTATWYIDPFGYAEVTRAAAGGGRVRKTDMLQVLRRQGFTAIQALAGSIEVKTPNHELLHHTFIYAPQPPSYTLAARMMEFPNGDPLKAQDWIPADVANYVTFYWKTQQAFEFAKSLVNDIAGDDIFEDVLQSLKDDINGPRLDVRKELVAHFADRATLISDYSTPITIDSERMLFAIELTNADAAAKAVKKAFQNDPDAEIHELEGLEIWEIHPQEDEEIEGPSFGGPGFGIGGAPQPKPKKEPRPSGGVAVAHGHLLIASHYTLLESLIKRAAAKEPGLPTTADYQQVEKELAAIGRAAGGESFLSFTRTDRSYRVSYELTQQGKMPESNSMMGQLMNRVLTGDADGVRKAQINGKNMPPFAKVAGSLGPAGAFVSSQPDGWLITGCLLTK